jgi:hypothetical protein
MKARLGVRLEETGSPLRAAADRQNRNEAAHDGS